MSDDMTSPKVQFNQVEVDVENLGDFLNGTVPCKYYKKVLVFSGSSLHLRSHATFVTKNSI